MRTIPASVLRTNSAEDAGRFFELPNTDLVRRRPRLELLCANLAAAFVRLPCVNAARIDLPLRSASGPVRDFVRLRFVWPEARRFLEHLINVLRMNWAKVGASETIILE